MNDRVQQLLEQMRVTVDALSVELSGNGRAPQNAQSQSAHTVAHSSRNGTAQAHAPTGLAQSGAQDESAHTVARPSMYVGRYEGKKEKPTNLPTPEKVFEHAKRLYRKRIGKTFGQLYRDISGQWAGMVAAHPGDVLPRAVDLWAAELNREYARSLRIPVAAFIKAAREYITAVEEGAAITELPSAEKPVTEEGPAPGPGFRRPTRQV